MGIRFPLEQSRPDLPEIAEVPRIVKGAPEGEQQGKRVPFDTATAERMQPNNAVAPPSSTEVQPPAQPENDRPRAGQQGTTGNLIDILA